MLLVYDDYWKVLIVQIRLDLGGSNSLDMGQWGSFLMSCYVLLVSEVQKVVMLQCLALETEGMIVCSA